MGRGDLGIHPGASVHGSLMPSPPPPPQWSLLGASIHTAANLATKLLIFLRPPP